MCGALHGRVMKIGIVGTGNMGRVLGVLWAELGHEVLFGARDLAKAQAATALSPARARCGTNDEAAAFGELVYINPRDVAVRDLLTRPEVLDGKVVIDSHNGPMPRPFELVAPSRSRSELLQDEIPAASRARVSSKCSATSRARSSARGEISGRRSPFSRRRRASLGSARARPLASRERARLRPHEQRLHDRPELRSPWRELVIGFQRGLRRRSDRPTDEPDGLEVRELFGEHLARDRSRRLRRGAALHGHEAQRTPVEKSAEDARSPPPGQRSHGGSHGTCVLERGGLHERNVRDPISKCNPGAACPGRGRLAR